MKKWCFIIGLVILAACQKGIEPFTDSNSSGSTTNSITGTWKFIAFSGAYQSTAVTTINDTDVSHVNSINFATTDSAGTFTFNDDSTFSANDISYQLSYTVHNYNYANGALTDSNNIPASYPADSANSTGTYELINNDSIYFPSGFVITLNTLTTPGGGNYKLAGNTLTITQKSVTDSTTESGGLPYHTTTNSTDTLILQKL